MEGAIDTDGLADELSEHMEFLRRLARALVRDEQAADDVVQETMLAALARQEEPTNMRAWLRSVLRRRVLVHFRTEQRRLAHETLLLRDAGTDAHVDGAEAGLALASLEHSTMLGTAVASLEEPYRTVIVQRFYMGLKPKTIAQRLGRPVGTVNTQLLRGLEQLRIKLDALGGGRRQWVSALLPFAIMGSDGWWPDSGPVSMPASVGALISGAAAVAVLVFVGVRTPRVDDTAVAIRSTGTTPAAAAAFDEERAIVATQAMARRVTPQSEELDVAVRSVDGASVDGVTVGVLRLQVLSATGPVVGALVSATSGAGEERRIARISSLLERGDGRKLKVSPPGFFLYEDPQPSAPQVTAITGSDGVAELRLPEGEGCSLQVTAAGLATKTLTLASDAVGEGQSVFLEVGARVVLTRGALQLDRTLFVILRSHLDLGVHTTTLDAGVQEIELAGLEVGLHRVEVLSAPGGSVSHRSLVADVTRESVARIDVSLEPRTDVGFSIRGVSPRAPAQFLNVHGPEGENAGPRWSEFLPVVNDVVPPYPLPSGPAVARVLSGGHEIGRATFEVSERGGPQAIEISLEPGELRLVHGPSAEREVEIEIARQPDDVRDTGGWVILKKPLRSDDSSSYFGLASGRYRVWVKRRASLQVHDVTIEDGLVELDIREEQANVEALRIERGEGVRHDSAIEVETAPGRWMSLASDSGVIQLTPGSFQLRLPLNGDGYVLRSIVVPEQSPVEFSEATVLRRVTIDCGPGWAGEAVRVDTNERLAVLPLLVGRTLDLDAQGVGILELRPGNYVLVDRFRRRALLSVDRTSERCVVSFE